MPGPAGSVNPAPIQPADGRVGFTVSSPATDEDFCVVPVVFSHADSDTRLEVGADGRPTEPFGIGGPIRFGHPASGSGPGSGAADATRRGGPAAAAPAIQAGTTVANATTQTVEISWTAAVVCTGSNPAQFHWDGRSATSLTCPGTGAVVGFAPGTLRPGVAGSLDYVASADPATAADRVHTDTGVEVQSPDGPFTLVPTRSAGPDSPPSITIDRGPAEGSLSSDPRPLISGDAQDRDGSVVSVLADLDGGSPSGQGVTLYPSGAWSWRPASPLGPGAHTLCVRAVDDAASRSVAVCRHFSVQSS